jgi:hypothetical protein
MARVRISRSGALAWGVVAMVEYFEQVVEDAKSCDDFVQHSSPLCAYGYCTRAWGDLTRWQVGSRLTILQIDPTNRSKIARFSVLRCPVFALF